MSLNSNITATTTTVANTNRIFYFCIFCVILFSLIGIGIAYWWCHYYHRNQQHVLKFKSSVPNPMLIILQRHQPDRMWPMQQISTQPYVWMIDEFLSESQCQRILRLAEQTGFKRSTVQTKEHSVSNDRTSFSTNLPRGHLLFSKQKDRILLDVEQQSSRITGMPVSHIEDLQVVRYQPNQQYKHHYDYFPPNTDAFEHSQSNGGQRWITLFVYLNDLDPNESGGQTDFPRLNLQVKPKRGRAVMWYNVDPWTGKENPQTFHAGLPPKTSVKYGLNIWIRERPFG